jgi:hypothetical protein
MMSEIQLNIGEPRREWMVATDGKSWGVQVVAWSRDGDVWGWNVYALIYEQHPLHKDVDAALNLHFHGGPTYDKRIVTSPAQGIRYDWQRESNTLKVGSDYRHSGDEYMAAANPKDGIPMNVQYDALQLARQLSAASAA